MSAALRARSNAPQVVLTEQNKVLDTVVQPPRKQTTFLEDLVKYWSSSPTDGDDKKFNKKSEKQAIALIQNQEKNPKHKQNEVGVTYVDKDFEAVVDDSYSEHEDDYVSHLSDGFSKIAKGTRAGLSILGRKTAEGLSAVAQNVAEGGKILMDKVSEQYEAYKAGENNNSDHKDLNTRVSKEEVRTEKRSAPKMDRSAHEKFSNVAHKMKRFEKTEDDESEIDVNVPTSSKSEAVKDVKVSTSQPEKVIEVESKEEIEAKQKLHAYQAAAAAGYVPSELESLRLKEQKSETENDPLVSGVKEFPVTNVKTGSVEKLIESIDGKKHVDAKQRQNNKMLELLAQPDNE